MPADYSLVLNLENAPEIYSYLLWVLNKIRREVNTATADKQINHIIEEIKLRFINHQPINDSLISNIIDKLKDTIPQKQYDQLQTTFKAAKHVPLNLEKRWENPFQRTFESLFAIQFIKYPTKEMLTATQMISNELIIILQNNRENPLIKIFLEKLTRHCQDEEAFGKFNRDQLSLEEVIQHLRQNPPDKFYQTLFIHFTFAHYPLRALENMSTPTPRHLLPGVFCDYLQQQFPEILTDTQQLNNIPDALRKDFIDGKMGKAEGFRDQKITRGRGEFTKGLASSLMGLTLAHQDSTGFPQLEPTQSWCPDSICQKPFYPSPYVQKILNNDMIYIAGASGMVTLMLGMMELLRCMPTQANKEQYAFAVAVYVASGGLHAFQEALYVAHDVLGYYPDYTLGHYETWLASLDKTTEFQQQENLVWQHYLGFCDRHFRYLAMNSEFKNRYAFFSNRPEKKSESLLANAVSLRPS